MKRKISTDAPDPIDIHVGMRVKSRRMGLGLSQTKLGEAIGVTFQQVQKYENGSNRISASSLYKIAETLGVEVAYFFEEMDTPGPGLKDAPQSAFAHDPMKSPETIKIMYNFARIADPEVRKQLYQFVKSLAKASE